MKILKSVLSVGTECATETLESVSDAVWQCQCSGRGAQINVLHSLVHHRGAGLLQHRRPEWTFKRQELPRCWEIREFLQLSTSLNTARRHSDCVQVNAAKVTWLRLPRVLCQCTTERFQEERFTALTLPYYLTQCLLNGHPLTKANKWNGDTLRDA